MLHVYGPLPPAAVNACEYAASCCPITIGESVVIVSGKSETDSANPLVAAKPPLSVTWAMKLNVPELVAAPLTIPAPFNMMPPGNEPPVSVQVYGAVPPAAVKI